VCYIIRVNTTFITDDLRAAETNSRYTPTMRALYLALNDVDEFEREVLAGGDRNYPRVVPQT
jgi:hypothetical protein